MEKKAGTLPEHQDPIAAGSKKHRSLRRFEPRLTSGRVDLTAVTRTTINARATYLSVNDSIGAPLCGRLRDYVIYDGLKAKPRIDFKKIGMDKAVAMELQARIEEDFHEWASSEQSDFYREQSFYEAQAEAYSESLKKGEVFFLAPHEEPDERDKIEISLRHQLIDADRVSNPRWMMDRPDLIAGIMLDKNSRHIGYWILDKHPGDTIDWKGANTWKQYSAWRDGERYIHHHIRRKMKPDALRGLSLYASVMDRIFDMRRYREAQIQSAINQANLAFSYFSAGDEEFSPFDELKDRQNLQALNLEPHEVGFESATLFEGGMDDRIEMHQPTYPHSNYVPFTEDVKKEIAAAIGIPHQVFEMLFDASFTASRAALLQFEDFVILERGLFGPRFCSPYYKRFVDEKVFIGDYEIPGYFDDSKVKEAVTGIDWEGKRIGAIDESKQAGAAKIRLSSKITSKKMERERMGVHHERAQQQIEEEEREEPENEEGNASTP